MIKIKVSISIFFYSSLFFVQANAVQTNIVQTNIVQTNIAQTNIAQTNAEETDVENSEKTELRPQPKTQLIPNLKAGEKIYELCATCHYADGWGKEDGSFPVIAGQHPNVIKKQLADFRSRDRDNPTMFPFTDNDTLGGAQGIEDVTVYISQLPANPSIGQGDGKHLGKGKKLFTENCAACHGKYAEGNNQALFPRLQGQHYAYLLRQLKWIRDGRRKNANPVMLEQIKTMDDTTLAIIADYISRIAIVNKETVQLPDSNSATKEKDEEPDCD